MGLTLDCESTCRPLLALLFRHSVKNVSAQEECLATLYQFVTRLYLPHAKLMRLHVCEINVVILTPEMAVAVGV